MTTDTATAADIGAGAREAPGSMLYEFWVVLLLGLAYGFAFYDRQMMSFLSPFVIPEFHLNNTQVGALGSALSLTWAIGAVAGVTAAAIGSAYYALPHGCAPYPYGGYSYYSCGGAYYEPQYQGDTVVYVTVPAPGSTASTTTVTTQ